MESIKSLDEISIIAALLHDVQTSHGVVFNSRSARLTLDKVRSRTRQEGLGFLTKTLPRLARAFDKALAGEHLMNSAVHGFATMRGSELPRFLGEFFSRVFTSYGAVLPTPCADSVTVIRLILCLFKKYELPYTHEQEHQTIAKFIQTEQDLDSCSESLKAIHSLLEDVTYTYNRRRKPVLRVDVAREARILLSRLFAYFDPTDIYPRHGPGVVATKQRLWGKYQWTNVCRRITDVYPLDAYFYASLGHVCDRPDSLIAIGEEESSARVILVPKDSRGPRLISCEPVDFQWVQQGLGRAIVGLVEHNPLTRFNVFFTNQQPNRFGALEGSKDGRYSTLDLNEASDRVSVELVRLLFPKHVFTCLEACRSLCTTLPNGRVLPLKKFAPMGSSLCFPVMALTIWAILTAAAPDADTRESILVYGDDVIVPTAFAANAIEQLESFGLKINHDKSCTKGFFRESCGMDAFKGVDVTPLKLRTVWSSTPTPESYTSWISYANSFYDRKCFFTYDLIVSRLVALYGSIPGKDMKLSCPSLNETPVGQPHIPVRSNRRLQKLEYRVRDVKSPIIIHEMDGWSMLLRFFAESANCRNQRKKSNYSTGNLPPLGQSDTALSGDDENIVPPDADTSSRARPEMGSIFAGRLSPDLEFCNHGSDDVYTHLEPFSVSSYTSTRTSKFVRVWR